MNATGTKLFHKDVFAPAVFFASPGVMRVRYSRHAVQAAADDRYGDLSNVLPAYVDIDECEIVEVEVADNEITKRVVRLPVDGELDLVLVISADGYVRTVWGNTANDKHRTLDRSKYAHRI